MADEYTRQEDPFAGFRFSLQIPDVTDDIFFKEITGLEAKTEVIEYQEGGMKQTLIKLPGRTTYTNLNIKRGVSTGLELWEWFQECMDVDRSIERRDIILTLYNPQEDEVAKVYNLYRAWPCRYKGPDFDAQSDTVVFEEVEFVYEFLEVKEAE